MKVRENVFTFSDKEEFGRFLDCLELVEELKRGSCYLSSLDNKVYKILISDFNGSEVYNYLVGINDVISTWDIDLKYFALPQEIYVCKDKVIGYNLKFVCSDLFDKNNIELFKRINFDKLLRAYFKMLSEVSKMSDRNIKINNLAYNLMFTGEELIGIDTLGYKVVDNKVGSWNEWQMDNAVKVALMNGIDNYKGLNEELKRELLGERDMECYIGKVRKMVKG